MPEWFMTIFINVITFGTVFSLYISESLWIPWNSLRWASVKKQKQNKDKVLDKGYISTIQYDKNMDVKWNLISWQNVYTAISGTTFWAVRCFHIGPQGILWTVPVPQTQHKTQTARRRYGGPPETGCGGQWWLGWRLW